MWLWLILRHHDEANTQKLLHFSCLDDSAEWGWAEGQRLETPAVDVSACHVFVTPNLDILENTVGLLNTKIWYPWGTGSVSSSMKRSVVVDLWQSSLCQSHVTRWPAWSIAKEKLIIKRIKVSYTLGLWYFNMCSISQNNFTFSKLSKCVKVNFLLQCLLMQCLLLRDKPGPKLFPSKAIPVK